MENIDIMIWECELETDHWKCEYREAFFEYIEEYESEEELNG